jgi:hypothetical protein
MMAEAAVAAICGEAIDCALPCGGGSLGILGIGFDGGEEGPSLPRFSSVTEALHAFDCPLDFPPRSGHAVLFARCLAEVASAPAYR